ncbi:hypothetical protein ACQ7HM_03005 [Williamsia sp. MIQD14]|uniref:hypothetical protein n=1 Tax=Williamsia sp. MIQD14 TaxID=3425703 RepID=UPI003DA1AB2C
MTLSVMCAQDAELPDALAHLTVTRAGLDRDSLRAGVAKAMAPLDVDRVVVVGGAELSDAFCGGVVSRLMIAERLDVEIAYVAPAATPGTAAWGLPHGKAAVDLALSGTAVTVPLIRDDAAVVIIGRARHLGENGRAFTGESIVDSERLFLGEATCVEIRPTRAEPGVEGALHKRFRQKWIAGRAVQTGGVDIVVERDGVRADRPVKRSTIYRHHEDWKLVSPTDRITT